MNLPDVRSETHPLARTAGLFRCAPGVCVALISGALGATPSVAAEVPWVAPKPAQSRKNPLPPSSAAAGAQAYATFCASCHGPTGRGDGWAAAALQPRPRDLTSRLVQQQIDGALFWKISTGRGAMPAWPWLTERERWSLVWAIREMGRAAATRGVASVFVSSRGALVK